MVHNEANKVPECKDEKLNFLENLRDAYGEGKTAGDSEPPPAPMPEAGMKRKSGGELPPPRKRQDTGEKNPIVRLHELLPGLPYRLESVSGPPHQPLFVVSVQLDGLKFTGEGSSKKAAKHSVAEKVLASFGADEAPAVVKMEDSAVVKMEESDGQFGAEGSVAAPGKSLTKILSGASDRNALMVLNEIHPRLEYAVSENSSSAPATRFSASVQVDGNRYDGYGPNKKQAKAAAARIVLSLLYGVSYGPARAAAQAPCFDVPHTFGDKIGRAVMTTFGDVMLGDDDHSRWKVLSGVAVTRGEDQDDVRVVGLATGTRCVTRDHVSMIGGSLNDCHAEVLCRRCLKDFLYSNLEMHAEGEGGASVLEPKPDGAGFRLKGDVKFHLFISSAPCGDSRMFCPHEDALPPSLSSKGLLRTKIKGGEGTTPLRDVQRAPPGGEEGGTTTQDGHLVQTWSGIASGQQRLLTMSCSDKIACWNVVGVQGALLSHFLDPVYLSSVVLGSLFHPDHLQRAVFGRVEHTLGDLPSPYRLNRPKMTHLTSPHSRHVDKPTPFALNWTDGKGRPEVVDAATGKVDKVGVQSRLSKRSFFQRFLRLWDGLPHVAKREQPKLGLYGAYKAAARDYREAKRAFCRACADAGLGRWAKKPVEMEEFELSF